MLRHLIPALAIIAIAILIIVPAGEAGAADKYAGEFLTHGVGARALGMGGAYVAVADGVTAGYWNPAGVADVRERAVQFMHSETFGDVVNYDTGAYVHPLDSDAGLALTVVRLAVDDIPFEQMWQDDECWIPHVLAGERIKGCVTFGEDNETVAAWTIEPWGGR